MQIGVDFDNTIVSYDGLFHKVAVEKSLIPPEVGTSKGAVRDYLRALDQENAWTELQGYVYGARMDLAFPYPGIDQFFSLCSSQHIPTYIISHKTLHPYLGPRYDLHQAAKNWLQKQSFSPPAFFELTLEKKLDRIKQQNCTIFIDDLPEIFTEKNFPSHVTKILFDPHKLHSPIGDYLYATSWDEISKKLNLSHAH